MGGSIIKDFPCHLSVNNLSSVISRPIYQSLFSFQTPCIVYKQTWYYKMECKWPHLSILTTKVRQFLLAIRICTCHTINIYQQLLIYASSRRIVSKVKYLSWTYTLKAICVQHNTQCFKNKIYAEREMYLRYMYKY